MFKLNILRGKGAETICGLCPQLSLRVQAEDIHSELSLTESKLQSGKVVVDHKWQQMHPRSDESRKVPSLQALFTMCVSFVCGGGKTYLNGRAKYLSRRSIFKLF